MEAFKKFRHDVEHNIIDGNHHYSINPDNSNKCLEGLRTHDEYSLNYRNDSDTTYTIKKFKLGEMNPQRC